VLNLLDSRGSSSAQEGKSETDTSHISLLRPEDAATRQKLKEAVVQSAPVSFAVQLQWSEQPIELGKVPSISIFRAYTLYMTEGLSEGRPGNYLRLGFFNDALSAKQVAYFVRSSFPAVAVVPVMEPERHHAGQSPIDPGQLADPFLQQIDQQLESSARSEAPAQPAAASPAPMASAPKAPPAKAASKPTSQAPPQAKAAATQRASTGPRGAQTLEQTLELLAASEIFNDDSNAETGVRHLNVQVQKRFSRSS